VFKGDIMNPIKTIFVQLFALALVFNRQVAAARDRNEIDKIKILEKIEENSANSTGRMLVRYLERTNGRILGLDSAARIFKGK